MGKGYALLMYLKKPEILLFFCFPKSIFHSKRHTSWGACSMSKRLCKVVDTH